MPCYTTRYEAAGFEGYIEWVISVPDLSEMPLPEVEPDDPWQTAWDYANEVCLLTEGHDGPHQFTPTNEIVVAISDAPPVAS